MHRGDGRLRLFVVGMVFLDALPADHRLIELADFFQRIGAGPIDFHVARIGVGVAGKLEIVELRFVAAQAGRDRGDLPERGDIPGIDLEQFQPGLHAESPIFLGKGLLQSAARAHPFEAQRIVPLFVVVILFLQILDEGPDIFEIARIAVDALGEHLCGIVEIALLGVLDPFFEGLLQSLLLHGSRLLPRIEPVLVFGLFFVFFGHGQTTPRSANRSKRETEQLCWPPCAARRRGFILPWTRDGKQRPPRSR